MKKKLKILLILLLIVIILPVGITLSKYIHNFITDYIMNANNFFFNSDKLTEAGTSYSINNWGGASNFTIQFQLNNHKNNLLTSESDIDYTIDLSCSSDVQCAINSASGTIYKTEMTDDFTITVTPNRVFDTYESVTVSVSATSSSPYVKTLSATFTVTVGRKGINYEISDSKNSPYLNFHITNSRESYKVNEAFGSYSVGDELSIEDYLELSDSDKNKCYCALITLTFDPRNVILDTTSNILKNATYTTTRVSGVDYISSITFSVDSMSSNVIRFYKNDVTENYTFPIVTVIPIIDFAAV